MKIYTPEQIALLLKMGLDPNVEYFYDTDKKKNYFYKNDLYPLALKVRSAANYACKKPYKEKSKVCFYLGCSYDVFRKHIEKQFLPGMMWENYGAWHIDHIVAVSMAKNEEEMLVFGKFTNLRPLWAKDNISKKNKKLYLL
jgi:hypothetical protein